MKAWLLVVRNPSIKNLFCSPVADHIAKESHQASSDPENHSLHKNTEIPASAITTSSLISETHAV